MDLFSVTAPLTIRYPDGRRHLVIEKFPHPEGLLYFQPYWHLPGHAQAVQLARGALRGEGPWKVGDAVLMVAGCRGADPEIALELAAWQDYLAGCDGAYASAVQILAAARRHGAAI